MEKTILTFDMGTQSMRASLVNDTGDILHSARVQFEPAYFSLHTDWAEQNGEYYWESLCKVSQELKEKAGADWQGIEGVTLTTFRDSDICLDKDGKPVRPAILWLDKREADIKAPIPLGRKILFTIAGALKIITYVRRICHCNYIRQEEPENWAKTDKFVILSTYLNFNLTGEMKDSAASLVGHFPFDTKKLKWQDKTSLTYPLYPVEKEKQCGVVMPGEVIGRITKAASELTGIPEGLPLIATGTDKTCETLGLSVTTPDKAAVSFGTAATINYTVDRYVEPVTFFPAYPSPEAGKWNDELQIYRGYWLLNWFTREFAAKEVEEAEKLGVAPEELMNRHLAEIPAGSDGLIFQPYFTDGITMPNARGAFLGFSDRHTRYHAYRAVIEGINYALMEGRDSLEKRTGAKAKEIYLAGGGSKSDEICQITADMFGVPCYRIQTSEATTLGASIVGFVGCGRFASVAEGVKAMVHRKDEFLPDAKNLKLYETIYKNVYLKIFPKLEKLYKIDKELTNR